MRPRKQPDVAAISLAVCIVLVVAKLIRECFR